MVIAKTALGVLDALLPAPEGDPRLVAAISPNRLTHQR